MLDLVPGKVRHESQLDQRGIGGPLFSVLHGRHAVCVLSTSHGYSHVSQ